MPPLPYTVTPNARSGRYLQFTPNSGMKKFSLPLPTDASMFPMPEPVRSELRRGLNHETPSCHWLSRNVMAPGFTAPPNGSIATATAAPPMPLDFMP